VKSAHEAHSQGERQEGLKVGHERAARCWQSVLGLCWIYAFQWVVSAGFSLMSLRMVDGDEYALYAASRSIALPLAAAYAMALRRAAVWQRLRLR
jgi:hypothetical protein